MMKAALRFLRHADSEETLGFIKYPVTCKLPTQLSEPLAMVEEIKQVLPE